jgi:RNA polymerase sigma factor (sigma-70 family)
MSEELNDKATVREGKIAARECEPHDEEGVRDGGGCDEVDGSSGVGEVGRERAGRKRTAFEASRRRLMSIAYRMLGSRAEAEDIVQETYLKWHAADMSALRIPAAWLTTVATRLAIDRLRRLQLEREGQAGVFVPEPWLEEFAPSTEALVSRVSDLSYGLLLLLERLSPEERAALVLHEAFDCGYSEIGLVLAKTAPACRQIVHRAKARLRGIDAARSSWSGRSEVAQRLLDRLRDAIESQDKEAFIGLMAEDAQVVMAAPDVVMTVLDAKTAMAAPDEQAQTLAHAHAANSFMSKLYGAGLSEVGLGGTSASPSTADDLRGMGAGVAIRISSAMLAERVAGRTSTRRLSAEETVFHGHHGMALIEDGEIVAILYVEARGEWIARCYLTTLPAHLSTANRLLGMNANDRETVC